MKRKKQFDKLEILLIISNLMCICGKDVKR